MDDHSSPGLFLMAGMDKFLVSEEMTLEKLAENVWESLYEFHRIRPEKGEQKTLN